MADSSNLYFCKYVGGLIIEIALFQTAYIAEVIQGGLQAPRT